MIEYCRIRFIKSICLVIRILSRKLYSKSHCAAKLYRWSDLKLFSLGRAYILPGFIYRLMACTLNSIISWNTVDWKKVRSKKLGTIADDLMHHIPEQYRYHKHSYMAPPVTGQGGRKL